MLTVTTAKKRIRAISATWVFGDMGSPSSPSLRDTHAEFPRNREEPVAHDPVARLAPGQGLAASWRSPSRSALPESPFEPGSAPPRRAAHAEPAAPEALHDSMRSP